MTVERTVCAVCGRRVGWGDEECRRGLYETCGPAEARDCERAGRLRAEALAGAVRRVAREHVEVHGELFLAVVPALEAALAVPAAWETERGVEGLLRATRETGDG